MSNVKRLVVRILRWLSAPDPTPAFRGLSRDTARGLSWSEKRESDPSPIPKFSPATRAEIKAIFDRAAARLLRERIEQERKEANR